MTLTVLIIVGEGSQAQAGLNPSFIPSSASDVEVSVDILGAGMHRQLVLDSVFSKDAEDLTAATHPPSSPQLAHRFFVDAMESRAGVEKDNHHRPLATEWTLVLPQAFFVDIYEIPSHYTVKVAPRKAFEFGQEKYLPFVDITPFVELKVSPASPFDLEIPTFGCRYRENSVKVQPVVHDVEGLEKALALGGTSGFQSGKGTGSRPIFAIGGLRITMPIHWRYDAPEVGGNGLVRRCIELSSVQWSVLQHPAKGSDTQSRDVVLTVPAKDRVDRTSCMDIPVGDLQHLALTSYTTLAFLSLGVVVLFMGL
jgi:hypothetical protein